MGGLGLLSCRIRRSSGNGAAGSKAVFQQSLNGATPLFSAHQFHNRVCQHLDQTDGAAEHYPGVAAGEGARPESSWEHLAIFTGVWISNWVFASYTGGLDHRCPAWCKLLGYPWTIMSIGLRNSTRL